MERDDKDIAYLEWDGDFNSHAHVERDLTVPILPVDCIYFNSHAHVERDAIYAR